MLVYIRYYVKGILADRNEKGLKSSSSLINYYAYPFRLSTAIAA